MTGPVQTVIGFDLGHGEMALAQQALTGRAEPEIIEINGKRSQITAYAEGQDETGQPVALIGEDAVAAFDLAAPDALLLEIGFKGHPSRNPKAETYVPRFASAVYQYLLERDIVAPDEAVHFFVGCPSGWSETERVEYEALLRQSNLPRLRVAAESRAALAHARETGALTLAQLKGPTLIIDIGSSTTDFTFQPGLNEETSSVGQDLGAALIDRAILDAALPQQEDAEALTALLDRYPSYRNRLELVCRKAKEGYFRRLDSELYRGAGRRPVHREMEDIQQRYVFRVTVDGPLMDAVLNQPFEELGGQSWQAAFRAALEQAHDRWLTPDTPPGVILATGGASRMDFIQPLCREVFAGWQYVPTPEPELTIARGLTRWGRNYLRTQGFDRDTAEVIQTDLPNVVEQAVPALIGRLAGPLADGMLERVIQPGLRDWRAGRVRTLDDLEGRLAELAEDWAQSDDVRQRLNLAISDWLKPVLARLHERILPICQRYGIAGDPFSILADFDPQRLGLAELGQVQELAGLAGVIREIVGVITAAVVGVLLLVVQLAFLRFGPLGWVVSGAVAGAVWFVGRDVAEGYVKTLDAPVLARRFILSDDRIRRIGADNRERLEASLRSLLESSDLEATLTTEVRARLETILQARVSEVRLLIG